MSLLLCKWFSYDAESSYLNAYRASVENGVLIGKKLENFKNTMSCLRKPIKVLIKFLPMEDDGLTKKQIRPKPRVFEEYVIWKKELKELSKAAFENVCAHLKVTDVLKKNLLSMKTIGEIKI